MRVINLILILSMIATSCVKNPLLSKYQTPYEIIPFHLIENKHYLPAFKEAMEVHLAEIDAIVNNQEAPNFENTIVALERSGSLLTRVASPFYNMLSAETNDELQQIAEQVSPLMSEHSNAIRLNEKLFCKSESGL